jgi:putative transposase
MQIQQEPLTDAQSSAILEIIGDIRKRKHDLKLIIEGIFWINRTGSQWRNLDSKFPKWQLVYYYFRKFVKDGSWQKINQKLVTIDRQKHSKSDTPTLVCIDSQSVKVPQFTLEAVGVDGNKKINGRKRHAIVDTLGNIFCVVVDAANHFDGIKGMIVWDIFTEKVQSVQKILADAGYKGPFTAHVEAQGYEIEIAARPPTERGFVPIAKRWVVERTFSWFNFFRRRDKDHEKTVQSSESMLYIAQIQILLNRHFKIAK